MEEFRLGRLLLSLELVKETDLEHALGLSFETRLPLGKILVMTEQLSDATLKTVVDAQWMLRDKLVTFDEASAAIDIAKRNRWTLADAMIVMGCPAFTSKGTRLGELLIASDVVSAEDLDQTLNAANESGLPLGRIMLLMDTLPEEVLNVALRLQSELRLGVCEPEEALEELRRAKIRVPSLQQTGAKLGELLVLAGLVNEGEVEVGIEMAQANGKMIGELLHEFGWVKTEVVEAGVELQFKIRQQHISVNDAVRVLKCVGNESKSLQSALEDCGLTQSKIEKNVTLYELLRLTGYMTGTKLQSIVKSIIDEPSLSDEIMKKVSQGRKAPKNIKEAIKVAIEDSGLLADVLSTTDKKSKALIEYAQKMQTQVQNGSLKLETALVRFACYKAGKQLNTTAGKTSA